MEMHRAWRVGVLADYPEDVKINPFDRRVLSAKNITSYHARRLTQQRLLTAG